MSPTPEELFAEELELAVQVARENDLTWPYIIAYMRQIADEIERDTET